MANARLPVVKSVGVGRAGTPRHQERPTVLDWSAVGEWGPHDSRGGADGM